MTWLASIEVYKREKCSDIFDYRNRVTWYHKIDPPWGITSTTMLSDRIYEKMTRDVQ